MKKSFLTLVCLVSLGLILLCSCDGDSDPSIVGTWEASEMGVMFAAGGVGEAPLPNSWKESLTFNADGSYSYSWSKDGRSGSGNGNWAFDGNELVLTDGNQVERTRYSLSASYLGILRPVSAGEAELLYIRQ